jgi:HEAT repeat protein
MVSQKQIPKIATTRFIITSLLGAKPKKTKLIASVVFGVMTLLLLGNTQIIAQTSVQPKCTEAFIQNQINQLYKNDPNRNRNAYNALVTCKTQAIPKLITALKHQNQQVRIMAITALAEIGSPELIAPLSNLLATEKIQDVRIAIIFALPKFGKQGIPSLVKALKDRDWNIRYEAANALGQIGYNAKSAREHPIFAKTLDSKLTIEVGTAKL